MTLRSRILACIPLVYGDELSKDMFELLQLLDRAMQGLESVIDQEGSGYMTLAEVEAQQTLADIRKQLDGDGNAVD